MSEEIPPPDAVPPYSGASPDFEVVPQAEKSEKKSRKKKESGIDFTRLNYLLENFTLIYGTEQVWDGKERVMMLVRHLRIAYGSAVVKMWLESDSRRTIRQDELIFDPARHDNEGVVNLFDGFEMKPKAGDWSPIRELLEWLCKDVGDSRADAIDWLLKWMAYPLQNRGAKMRTALVFHGLQGAGKNFMFERILGSIYGRYTRTIGQYELSTQFNDWASQVLLVIADEVVSRAEIYNEKNILKSYITGETVNINPKNVGRRVEANHMNFIFLSNENIPVPVEQDDRRYFVVYTPSERLPDALVERVRQCIAQGGVEAFYHGLLKYPLEGFTEYALPPMTTAKERLIELGLRPSERFIDAWIGGDLPVPKRPAATQQIYRVYQRWCYINGERAVGSLLQFAQHVGRRMAFVAKRDGLPAPPMRLAQIRFSAINRPRGYGDAVRVWVPADYVRDDDASEGAWAAQVIDLFEREVDAYCNAGGVL